MLHPHSDRWVPYADANGNAVTITWDQVRAVLHAMAIVDEVRATQSRVHPNGLACSNPPLHEDFPEKSRALGRLLIEGKPLFEDMPPYELGAAAYWVWDAENDEHKAALDEKFFGVVSEDTVTEGDG